MGHSSMVESWSNCLVRVWESLINSILKEDRKKVNIKERKESRMKKGGKREEWTEGRRNKGW